MVTDEPEIRTPSEYRMAQRIAELEAEVEKLKEHISYLEDEIASWENWEITQIEVDVGGATMPEAPDDLVVVAPGAEKQGTEGRGIPGDLEVGDFL